MESASPGAGCMIPGENRRLPRSLLAEWTVRMSEHLMARTIPFALLPLPIAPPSGARAHPLGLVTGFSNSLVQPRDPSHRGGSHGSGATGGEVLPFVALSDLQHERDLTIEAERWCTARLHPPSF
jgi:hypothetical protein